MPGSTSRQSRSRSRTASGDSVDSFSSGRRFIIKPLSTVGDSGKPSHSVVHDLQRVVNFIEDERHLVAYDLYLNIQARLDKLKELKQEHDRITAAATARGKEKGKKAWMKSKRSPNAVVFDEEEFNKACDLLKEHKEGFDLLKKRAPLFVRCRDNMDASGGWTLAQTIFGVTTYYRREEDGSLSIKLEGELRGIPLFEQVAVLREIDLHCHWAPFVTSSQTLGHIDKLDTVGWFMLGLPNFGIARDSCFRAVGCDCVAEDGSVLMVGRGVEDHPPDEPGDESAKFLAEDPVLKTLDIPPVPSRIGSGRMTMKMFEAKISVLGPDHCHTYILANVDPNLAFIPQSLLEFVMKKMCGFLLNKLQTAAKKITRDPVRNIHAQRMRDESAFYQQWLLPKFRAVAADKGWDEPTIAAFELSPAQEVEADKLNAKRTRKMHSFSQFEATDKANSEGSVSTRSAPAFYRSRDTGGSSDDDSDISSLSETSQSVWKNNPISSYLREIETKTQDRKERAVVESRRKAAARLRPRPLPVDKKRRLRELKMHKERKQRGRGLSSSGSMGGGSLPPVDEKCEADTVHTGRSGRSIPYSPITAALKEQGSGHRIWVVSGLVMVLFILLHLDKFLPAFPRETFGMWSIVLRDATTICYIVLCGAIHFLLCDVELIYAFEAFEMGMKTGEQVKTFYRGKVRLVVAAGSGVLVGISIFKAVLRASLKASIMAAVRLYNSLQASSIAGGEIGDNTAAGGDVTVEGASSEEAMDEKQTILSHIPGALFAVYSVFMKVIYAVFDWQMRVFVHSNIIGRSMERLVAGVYSLWIGILSGIGDGFYSLVSVDQEQECSLSWRDDAIGTLRNLLLYTAVFLLLVLALTEYVSKSYRYKDAPPPDYVPNTLSNGGSDATSMAISTGGSMPIPKPKKVVSPTDSAARRRLKFRMKRKESLGEGDESD